MEKAAFDAAETYYIDTDKISKLETYLLDYPNGAYTSEAMYYIGHHYYSKRDYASAMDALNDALNGNEDAAFAQRAMALKGAILLEQGKGEEALEVYRTWATKATNNDNYALAQLGMVRSAREAQQWGDLVESADVLLESGYTLSGDVEQEVMLARAIANAQLGNKHDARVDLTSLAQNPQSEAGAQAAYELAKMRYDEGDLAGAEKMLDEFFDSGTSQSYWVAKGFILLCDIYHDNGEDDKAVEHLVSLKKNYPGKEGEIFNEIDSRLEQWKKSK